MEGWCDDLERHQRLVVVEAEEGPLQWKVSKPRLFQLRELEGMKGTTGSEMKMRSGECLRIMLAKVR